MKLTEPIMNGSSRAIIWGAVVIFAGMVGTIFFAGGTYTTLKANADQVPGLVAEMYNNKVEHARMETKLDLILERLPQQGKVRTK